MHEDQAAALHAASIVIDGLEISRFDEDVFHNQLRGGLTAVNATVAVLEDFRQTCENIAAWKQRFERFNPLVTHVESVADIRRAKEEGKVGIIFGFQNTSPIEQDLDLLSIFKELGVRIIQLCYMQSNYVGDGCLEPRNGGLTRFGHEVIEEMNRLGILIDLSHVGYRTTMEAIEASQGPVAFTHANPRSLCDHPRNKTDEQLKAVAAKGGVVGANCFPPFLAAGDDATIEDFIDVIDYMANLIGIDHVAVGTDFTEGQPKSYFDWMLTGRSKRGPELLISHPIKNPVGLSSSADFGGITAALLKRGYSDRDVKKVMGANWLRLFEEVWK
jgi:membrane dipeptidase